MAKALPIDLDKMDVTPDSGRPGTRELGPSDSSDSGSDLIGSDLDAGPDSDTDSQGTGEGRDARGGHGEELRDVAPDRIINGPDDFSDSEA